MFHLSNSKMFPARISQYVKFNRTSSSSRPLPSLEPVSPPKPSSYITSILKAQSPEDLKQLEGKLCDLETKMIEALQEVPEKIEKGSQDCVILEQLRKNKGTLNSLGHEIKEILSSSEPVIEGEMLEHLEQNNKRYRAIKSLLAEIARILS